MLTNLLVYLLALSLPFQYGKHFWPDFTKISGFRLDYFSPTLYFNDFVICLLFLINLPIIFRFFTKRFSWFLIFASIINIVISLNPTLTLLSWIKLYQLILLCYFLIQQKYAIRYLYTGLKISTLFVCFLAWSQFVVQHSIGGPLYYFGERPISSILPQVAKIDFLTNIIRPYSTFSHPNSLAGYLIVAYLIIKNKSEARLIQKLILLTIFITFSKAAIFTLFIIRYTKLDYKKIIFLAVVVSLFFSISQNQTNIFSIDTRLKQYPYALKIISEQPFSGVGLNNYIIALSEKLPKNQLSYTTLQPIHNTMILILAELGLPLALIFITVFAKSTPKKYLWFIVPVTLLCLVDHYWWTLIQNKLILAIAFAISNKSTQE